MKGAKMPLGLLLVSLLAPSSQKTVHAVLVGVDDYEQASLTRLTAAEADASAVANALIDSWGAKKQDVTLLVTKGSHKPTRKNVLGALDTLKSRVQPGDTVIFLFAGHGVQPVGLEAILCTSDFDPRDRDSMKASGVSASEVRERLGRLPAGVVMAAYDMCRNDPLTSGTRSTTVANTLLPATVRAGSVRAPELTRGPATSISLFACSPAQVSYEWKGKQRGFFSYYLEEAIRGGAADASGAVAFDRVLAYVDREVSRAVQRELGRDQNPAFEITNLAGLSNPVARTSAPKDATGPTEEQGFTRAYDLAREAYSRGDRDGGWTHLKAAIAARPDAGATYLAAGNLLMGELATEQAIVYYRKSLTIDPDNPETHFRLALAISLFDDSGATPQVGKNELESRKHFERALELDPTNVNYWLTYAARTSASRRSAAAKRAMSLSPDNDEVHFRAGMLIGDWEALYRELRVRALRGQTFYPALEAVVQGPLTGDQMALAAFERHKLSPAEAIQALERFVEFDPDCASAQSALAFAAFRAGDKAKGLRALKLAYAAGVTWGPSFLDQFGVKRSDLPSPELIPASLEEALRNRMAGVFAGASPSYPAALFFLRRRGDVSVASLFEDPSLARYPRFQSTYELTTPRRLLYTHPDGNMAQSAEYSGDYRWVQAIGGTYLFRL